MIYKILVPVVGYGTYMVQAESEEEARKMLQETFDDAKPHYECGRVKPYEDCIQINTEDFSSVDVIPENTEVISSNYSWYISNADEHEIKNFFPDETV